MYQVKIKSDENSVSNLDNAQLICGYIFLKKTAEHFYHKKLSALFELEKRAIIRDLTLFEKIKNQKYSLRCSTPQKWIENWEVYKNLKEEIEKRNIQINNFEFH